MKVIVCLDDDLGMTFNHRRQSRDRVVIADILRQTEGHVLYISPFSQKLFEEGGEYTVSDKMLDIAGEGEYCFVENEALAERVWDIEELVIYRWNRKYPADRYFDIDIATEGFGLVESCELEGYSHEKITKEIFRR